MKFRQALVGCRYCGRPLERGVLLQQLACTVLLNIAPSSHTNCPYSFLCLCVCAPAAGQTTQATHRHHDATVRSARRGPRPRGGNSGPAASPNRVGAPPSLSRSHCRSRPVVPPRCVSCTNSYLSSGFCGGDARNNCDFARWNSRVPVTVSLPVLFLRQVFRWESPTGRKFQYCVFNFMFHVSTSMSLQLIIGGYID